MNKLEEFLLPNHAPRFPFIGTRQGGEPFEYLLMDIDKEKVNIAIFKWLVNHTTLRPDEKIDLYLPLKLTKEFEFKDYATGVVTFCAEERVNQEYRYEVTFNHSLSQNLEEVHHFQNVISD